LERQEVEDNGFPFEDHGLVFTRERSGVGLDPDGTSSRWNRLVKASGLKTITFHEARHTNATILLKSGVPVHVVSKRLGHASEGFTLMQYAHVIPGQGQDAAARLAALVDA
jgi:integrase